MEQNKLPPCMPLLSYCRGGALSRAQSTQLSCKSTQPYCLLESDSDTLVSFSDRATGCFSSVMTSWLSWTNLVPIRTVQCSHKATTCKERRKSTRQQWSCALSNIAKVTWWSCRCCRCRWRCCCGCYYSCQYKHKKTKSWIQWTQYRAVFLIKKSLQPWFVLTLACQRTDWNGNISSTDAKVWTENRDWLVVLTGGRWGGCRCWSGSCSCCKNK